MYHCQGSSDLTSHTIYCLWNPPLYGTVEGFEDVGYARLDLDREVAPSVLGSDTDRSIVERSRDQHRVVSDSIYSIP